MASCRVVAVTYAKGRSSRVPGKNTRKLGGDPLWWHITAAALRCPAIGGVFVDTDSEEIAEDARSRGVAVRKRPSWLATDSATGDDLVANTAAQCNACEIIVQLYPTSPFVDPASLAAGVAAVDGGFTSATAVRVSKDYIWKHGRPAREVVPSQTLADTIIETTGFYVTRRDWALRERTRVNPASCFGVDVSAVEAIDIDYPEDFLFAEIVWRGLHS